MINFQRLAVALIFTLSTTTVHAQTVGAGTQGMNNDEVRANNTASSLDSTTTNSVSSDIASTAISTTPSHNNASKKSSNMGRIAMSVALAVGGVLVAKGVTKMSNPTTYALGAVLFAMGMMAFKQSKSNGDSSAQNSSVATQSESGNANNGTNVDSGSPSTAQAAEFAAASAIKQAEKLGLKVDPTTGTVTLPNGKKISANDIGDLAAMGEAGITAGDWNTAKALAAEAEKKALKDLEKSGLGAATAEMGFADGGGGAGGSGTTEIIDDGSGGGSGRGVASADGLKKSGANGVAGMVRNYNGDMIGVAGDDIFEMMARCYRKKTGTNDFLPESGVAPASAPMKR